MFVAICQPLISWLLDHQFQYQRGAEEQLPIAAEASFNDIYRILYLGGRTEKELVDKPGIVM